MKNQLVNTTRNFDTNAPLFSLTVGQFEELIAGQKKEEVVSVKSEKKIIGIDEVCQMLDYKKPTVYALVHKRQIPFFKPQHGGRKLYFRRDEIEEWMQENRVETTAEYVNERVKGNSL